MKSFVATLLAAATYATVIEDKGNCRANLKSSLASCDSVTLSAVKRANATGQRNLTDGRREYRDAMVRDQSCRNKANQEKEQCDIDI